MGGQIMAQSKMAKVCSISIYVFLVRLMFHSPRFLFFYRDPTELMVLYLVGRGV